ncbi:MAG: hypothetical protein RIB98_17640 [Acidimicrobiales bacterium]
MNDYETLVAADSCDENSLACRLAGAMQAVRVGAPVACPDPLVTVGAGVAVPVTIAFTLWAAQRAEELDLERLYFAGRNGYLPWVAYDRLPSQVTGDVPGTYIRVSRDVVRQAAAALDPDRWIACGHETPTSFLRQHADRMPLRRLLGRAVADPEQHRQLLHGLGLELDAPLPDGAGPAWRAVFASHEVRDAIAETASNALPLLRDWLAQHGFLDNERVGLVDVGWRGQQAAMLDLVLQQAGGADVHHLHLGRNKVESLLTDARIDRYLIDVERPLVKNPVALFETLYATTQPGLTGLRRSPGGVVEPVFREGPDPVGRSPHILPLRDLVISAVDAMAPRLTSADRETELRPRVCAVARRFWESPTPAEARWWSTLPYELDASGRLVRPLGAPVRLAELPDIVRRRSLGDRQWSRGAVMASSPLIRYGLSFVQRLPRTPAQALSVAGRG